MRSRFRRSLLYCLCLVGTLAGLSLYFYRLPSQVEQRIRKNLGEILAVADSLALADCHGGWGGEFRVGRLAVPASPVLDHPILLEMTGVEAATGALISRNATRSPGLPYRAATGVSGQPGAPRRANLILADHLLLRLQTRSTRDGRRAWNYEGILPSPFLESVAGGGGQRDFLLRTARFDVAVHRPGARGPEIFRLHGEDLEIAGWYPGGHLGLEGTCRLDGATEDPEDSGEASPVPGGRFELLFSPRRGIDGGTARFRNVHRLRDWLPLLPPGLARFEEEFRPRGTVDVEIDIESAPAGASGAGQAPARERRIAVRVRHLDSTFQLFDTGWPLEHLSGTVSFDEGGEILLGARREEDGPPLRASFGGHEARLSGGADHRSLECTLRLPRVELGSLAQIPGSGWAGALAGALALRGTASVDFSWKRPAGESERGWSMRTAVEEATSPGLPFMEDLWAHLESTGSTPSTGQTVVNVDKLSLRGLGSLRGIVTVAYTPETLEVSLGEIRVGEKGEVRGSLSRHRADDEEEWLGDIKAKDLVLKVGPGLLELEVETLRLQPPRFESADAGSTPSRRWTAAVEATLSGAVLDTRRLPVPEAILLEEELHFQGGTLSARLSPAGLDLVKLDLRSTATRFRFQGSVAREGFLQGLGALATAGAVRLVDELPDDLDRWARILAELEEGPAERPAAPPVRNASDRVVEEPGEGPSGEPSRIGALPLPLLAGGSLSRPALRWLTWRAVKMMKE